jgi:enamine deaminase RidA (YjgF/YER057c/UK114 family)
MIRRIEPGSRFSQVVIANGFAFLAGQVADDTSVGVREQTQQVLASIDRLLAKVGSDKSRIVSATVYLSDISTFAEMNAAWDAWVAADAKPARATVEAKLADPVYRVEIQVIALAG